MRKIVVIIMTMVIMLSLMHITAVNAQGQYRTPITIINNADQDLTDYQVKIELNSSWDGWSYVSSDGSDIYFLDSSNNPLYYWIESFDYTNQEATIWVKVPSIPANGQTTIYMYYGGTNPYSDYNDPEQVFLFYDDFEGSSSLTIDNIRAGSTYSFDNTWSIHGSYSFKYSDTSSSDYGEVRIYTSYTTLGIVVEVYVKPDLDQTKLHVFGFYFDRTLGIKYTASTSEYSLGVIDVETKVTEGWSNNLYKFVGKFKPNGILTIEYYDDTGFLVDSYTTTNSYTIDVIGLKFYTGGGQVGDIWVDLFIVRKFVDPEPSVSIGSSEAVGDGDDGSTSSTISSNSTTIVEVHSISVETTALFMMILFIVNTVLLVIRRGIIWAIIEALFPFIMYYYGFSIEIVVISLFMAVGAIIMVVRS